MADFSIRALESADREMVLQFTIEHWGADKVIAHGVTYFPHTLPGFVATTNGEIAGLLTYHLEGNECEIVTLDSLREAQGIGSALIGAAKEAAKQTGCRRLWLITTNDNLNALRFYQKRGFCLVAVHRNAVNESRKLKPEIPLTGDYGIPLRDEIELEMRLD